MNWHFRLLRVQFGPVNYWVSLAGMNGWCMLNLRAGLSSGRSYLNVFMIFASFVSVTILMGCATGRSLSKSELSEFESLANEKNRLESQTRDARRKLQKLFSRTSVHSDTEYALLCGGGSKQLSTGKVPLVFAKPKRVIFKPNRKPSRNGCAQSVIEVKP